MFQNTVKIFKKIYFSINLFTLSKLLFSEKRYDFQYINRINGNRHLKTFFF